MKEKLIWIVAIVLAMVFGFYGQKVIMPMLHNTEQIDSVEQGVETAQFEQFTTPESVLLYKRDLELQTFYDSMMVSLPPEIVEQVSGTLIDKYGNCTKEEIINEYVDHADIYDSFYKRQCASQYTTTNIDTTASYKSLHQEEANTNRPRDANEKTNDFAQSDSIK